MNNLLLKKKEGRPSLRGRTSLALLRAYQRRTTANRDAQLSRRRSRVRVPSLPFTRVPANRHLLLSIQARVRAPTLIVCCPSCRARLNPKREESAPRWGHKEKDHHERKDEPMKLTTMTQVTVDGVMQGNGGATDEDRRSGFERGGWAMGVFDNETMTFINQTYQRADAFLFGRRTYELFAGYWGAIEEMRAHPIGVALNETPKYLVSNTLTDPQWADTTVLSGDLAAAIGELKAKPAGELQVHGSGALIRWLLENDLVDE